MPNTILAGFCYCLCFPHILAQSIADGTLPCASGPAGRPFSQINGTNMITIANSPSTNESKSQTARITKPSGTGDHVANRLGLRKTPAQPKHQSASLLSIHPETTSDPIPSSNRPYQHNTSLVLMPEASGNIKTSIASCPPANVSQKGKNGWEQRISYWSRSAAIPGNCVNVTGSFANSTETSLHQLNGGKMGIVLNPATAPATPIPSNAMPNQPATPAPNPWPIQTFKTPMGYLKQTVDPGDPNSPSDPDDPRSSIDPDDARSSGDPRDPKYPGDTGHSKFPAASPPGPPGASGGPGNIKSMDPSGAATSLPPESSNVDAGRIMGSVFHENIAAHSNTAAKPGISVSPLAQIIGTDSSGIVAPFLRSSSNPSYPSIASDHSPAATLSEMAPYTPNPSAYSHVAANVVTNTQVYSSPDVGGPPQSPAHAAGGEHAPVSGDEGARAKLSSVRTELAASQAAEVDSEETDGLASRPGQAAQSEKLPTIKGGQISVGRGTLNSESYSVPVPGESPHEGSAKTLEFSRPTDPAFSTATPPALPVSAVVLTVSGDTYTALNLNRVGQSGGVAVLSGSNLATLSAGGPAIAMGTHTISADPDGLAENGVLHSFSPIGPPPAATESESRGAAQVEFTVGGTAYTAFQRGPSGNGEVVIPSGSSSITLSIGGSAVTIGTQSISAARNGVVEDGSTHGFSLAVPAASATLAVGDAPRAEFTISGQAYTAFETSIAGGGDVVVIPSGSGPVTLTPGGSDTSIAGEAVSAVSDGLIVGTSTRPFSAANLEAVAPFIISGLAFTAFKPSAGGRGEVVVPSGSGFLTLVPGSSAATIDGEVVSAASDGFVIGSSTEAFETITGATLPTTTDAGAGPDTTSGATPTDSMSPPGLQLVSSAGKRVEVTSFTICEIMLWTIGVAILL